MQEQLPQGCEIFGIEILREKKTFQASSAEYEFVLADVTSRAKANIENFQRRIDSGEAIMVRRDANPKKRARDIDVSVFINSVKCDVNILAVDCSITSVGSVRVDEIMRLLEIDETKLAGPVKRKSVRWVCN